jgi:mono/diheme cytochrome c family protein
MNAELKSTTAAPEAEPTSTLTTLPIWLVVLLLLLLFWGGVSFDRRGGWFEPRVYGPYVSVPDVERFQPRSRGGPNLSRGKVVYEMTCALCHGVDGMGKPGQFPPVAGSEWVNAPGVNRVIRIPLVGLSGPIKIKDQEWNLAMPAMGAALSDDDLAAALSYMRQAWGNKASPVTAEQVKAIRAELGNRAQPLSADELLRLPEELK